MSLANDTVNLPAFTPGRAAAFFMPLFLQSFFQSLTYPLAASIISAGPLGDSEYSTFAQGQTVMFMIGALAGGAVMTGMVFARTVSGFKAYRKMNIFLSAALVAVEVVLSLPPLNGILFGRILQLPPKLVEIASWTLLWSCLMQACFYWRNISIVPLLNARASFKANLATVIRICLMASAPFIFLHFSWTGYKMGLVALTVPIFAEAFFTWVFARKYVRTLPGCIDAAAPECGSAWRQFVFMLPISLGCLLLASAPFAIAAFVAHTPSGIEMRNIHYITFGIINPVAFGVLRMQAVAVSFPPEHKGDRRVLWFAVSAGCLFGALPMAFALIRPLSHAVFCGMMHLDAQYLDAAMTVMAIYCLLPLFQSLRGYTEGFAVLNKCSKTVFVGQIANVAALLACLYAMLRASAEGWMMGPVSILVSCLVTVLAVNLLMKSRKCQ